MNVCIYAPGCGCTVVCAYDAALAHQEETEALIVKENTVVHEHDEPCYPDEECGKDSDKRLALAEGLLREFYDECESEDPNNPLTEDDTIWPTINGELVARTREFFQTEETP